jgi:hypothetical protein
LLAELFSLRSFWDGGFVWAVLPRAEAIASGVFVWAVLRQAEATAFGVCAASFPCCVSSSSVASDLSS